MVYVFLANGFEEIEALTPIDMLKRAQIDVLSVSVNKTAEVVGAHGIKVIADKVIGEVIFENIDAVILPGGMPGSDNLNANKKVHLLVDEANEKGALICAICAAPYILGEKGLLENKKAVCFPGFEHCLHGAFVQECGCVRDGNIITAKSMGKAIEFSCEIISALKGVETAEKIKNSIFA